MASRQATARLRTELKAILSEPPPYIHVSYDEANMLAWNYLLEGPPDTPYEGGWYWGRLRFPKDYPFHPPSILMMTPNGRFQTNMRLCLTMSDYHPETWQPGWCLAAVLKALLSFMCEETPTTGAVEPPTNPEERRRLAAASLQWNREQGDFMQAFPEFDQLVARTEERRSRGETLERPRPAEQAAAAQLAAPSATQPGPADAGPLIVGDVVRIVRLVKRPDLNNHEGVVVPTPPEHAGKGRVFVKMPSDVIGARPQNVEFVRRPACAEATAGEVAEEPTGGAAAAAAGQDGVQSASQAAAPPAEPAAG